MPLKLHTVICSTRPGRIGAGIGHWFHSVAAHTGDFEAKLVDLAEFDLPIYDEPQHPVTQHYEHEHTRRWAESVDAADAFVFVTPEYNFGPPPSLLNALNFVYKEWNYKPAAFVSYGGISGGIRAVEMEKKTLTTLKMVPIMETVAIPNVFQYVDENKNFSPIEPHINAANTMLKELARWAEALKPLRNERS